ncbi:MAG: DUF92 domain-containing protein [Acidobacteriota bacterium]|nr:MAG: DUF92 domain-containing protein [Acidobacteriota bacterium]
MTAGEFLRKILHIGLGASALLLAHLPWWGAAAACLGGFFFSYYVLPRLTARRLERPEEHGFPVGMYAYPLSLGLLCLLFPNRLEVVAVAFGMMAFGDGAATLAGLLVGGPAVPWNFEKRWSGFAAFWLFGTLSSGVLYAYVAEGRWTPWSGATWLFVAATAAVAAFVESYPSGLDDNIVVPIAAALFFYSLDSAVDASAFSWEFLRVFVHPFLEGVVAVGVVAVLARALRLVSRSGWLGGWILGIIVYAAAGWRGFLTLLAFFALATAATRFGYARKAAVGVAQERGGRRGAKHALANCGVGVWLSLCAAATVFSPDESALWKIALVASFATALFDTLGTEIGQALGRTPVLLTRWRVVAPGTEGAVSLEGTAAGAAGALLLAGFAWLVGLIPGAGVAAVFGGAFGGAVLESLLGERLPRERVDNEFLNFVNTAVGAAIAYALGVAIL